MSVKGRFGTGSGEGWVKAKEVDLLEHWGLLCSPGSARSQEEMAVSALPTCSPHI